MYKHTHVCIHLHTYIYTYIPNILQEFFNKFINQILYNNRKSNFNMQLSVFSQSRTAKIAKTKKRKPSLINLLRFNIKSKKRKEIIMAVLVINRNLKLYFPNYIHTRWDQNKRGNLFINIFTCKYKTKKLAFFINRTDNQLLVDH